VFLITLLVLVFVLMLDVLVFVLTLDVLVFVLILDVLVLVLILDVLVLVLILDVLVFVPMLDVLVLVLIPDVFGFLTTLVLVTPLSNLTLPGRVVKTGREEVLDLLAGRELGDGWPGVTVCVTVTVRTLYCRSDQRQPSRGRMRTRTWQN